MTSLILVQTSSIIQALEIKEEQFNAAVNSALSKVAYQLEMEEASALTEYAKDISITKGNGIFPGNIQQSISGTLNLKSTKLSFQYSQQSTGVIQSEELKVDYGEKDPNETPNERGKPGDYPNAF